MSILITVYTLFIKYLQISRRCLQIIAYLGFNTSGVLLLKTIIHFLQQSYSNTTVQKKDASLLTYTSN